MTLSTYLAAMDGYLDGLLSKDLPYFPLSFTPRDPLSRRAVASTERSSLKQLALMHPRLAIVGPPGAGKTRATRDLAKSFCVAILRHSGYQGPLPLYIPLRYLAGSIDSGMHWADLLVPPLNYTLRDSNCHFTSGQQLVEMVAGREWILLIDGLNEISNHELVKVLNVLETCPVSAHVVLTSRIREYPTEYKTYAVYDLRPLSFPYEVRGFLGHMLPTQEAHKGVSAGLLQACEHDAVLRQLATNPYLLSQLFQVARRGLPLPHDRVSLLELVARNLIHEQSLDATIVQAILTDLAGEMQFDRQTLKMSVEAIVSRPRGGITETARLTNLLARLIDVRLLVRSRSSQDTQRELQRSDEVGFHHQVFQEFFAGVHLYEQHLRLGTARTARRRISRYCRSRWNWETICTAIALLTRERKQNARPVLRWLVRSRPHLAALIQSEIPESAATLDDNMRLNEVLVNGLKSRAAFCALWVPHCYNWLPAVLIALVVALIWSMQRAAEPAYARLGLLPTGDELRVGAVLTLIVPIAYTAMLCAIYRWLDDALFDRWVHPSLASLELVRFRGGREPLRQLRMRAAANPFISGRMKSWIVSSPVVPLVDVHERHSLRAIKGVPESRRDITPQWVASLFQRLHAPTTEETERILIVEALTAALRILGSGEALHIAIYQGLEHFLRHGAKGRVRRRLAAALETEERAASFWTQLFRHWRRSPALWVFVLGLAALACATYFGWPTVVTLLTLAMAGISALADIIGVITHGPRRSDVIGRA